ncbi:histidine phosphatase family protein [Anaeromyxobacter oryzae]|uniref:Phosphoglycerate mutase n=1 Tax=Anaeromyxobacter oryzae TaxID=2918170 RepID=A0ABN6MVB0_9BACT|nr:histidine phosphatase family protein [Anaeromyxobacter oryzae]BDG04871.1 phosphoglycerate mutase [Anaeromyxobacter oryzae]
MRELFIVRHGETEWSRIGRHTGRTDLPLTAKGEDQARALGPRLAGRNFARVLASPLRRAWDTARLAGFGDVAERVPDAMEWDYGAYEGRTRAEILAETPGWTIWTGGVPRGESIEDVALRADRVLALAGATDGDVLLFAHGHLLRVLALRWLGLDPRLGARLALGPARVGVLSREGEVPVLGLWNAAGP